MFFFNFCLFYVFIQFPLFVCQTFQEDRCTAPDGQRGECLNIRQCQPVIAILSNAPKPLPQSTRQMLVALNCGFEQRDPKVCCVLSNNNRPFTNTRIPPQLIPTNPPSQRRDPAQPISYYSEAPPLVEGHPNIRLLPTECGEADEDRILGGTKAKIYEMPWMTLIAYTTPNGQKFKCGGTIINNKYILTAAHCLVNLRRDVLSGVRIGEHDISKEIDCDDEEPNKCAPLYQDLAIEEITTHPNYLGVTGRGRLNRHQNDIGLIRVASAIDLSGARTKPVCLPLQRKYREAPLNNESLWVSGWGITEDDRTSSYLLKVRIPYFPNDQCAGLLNSTIGDGIGFRQFCAGGEEGKDSCAGDSGGPLQVEQYEGVLRYYQYGIVSFGSRNCGRLGVPGVYTRVTHYLRWILDTIRP